MTVLWHVGGQVLRIAGGWAPRRPWGWGRYWSLLPFPWVLPIHLDLTPLLPSGLPPPRLTKISSDLPSGPAMSNRLLAMCASIGREPNPKNRAILVPSPGSRSSHVESMLPRSESVCGDRVEDSGR